MRMLEWNATYKSYHAMKQRCFDLHHPSSRRHGQRGIRICKRWLGQKGFANFLTDMGERPAGLTLDRIDSDGNYTPRNCRWATRKEQAHNRVSNKLTSKDVAEIRASSLLQRELAEKYHVTDSHISMVQSGKRW